MDSEAKHHFILSLDVQGSASRTDHEKLALRQVVYAVVGQAFDAAGVDPADRRIEDRGDGVLALVSPTVPESRMMGTWVETAREVLRESNRRSGDQQRVRVRLGLHCGQVHEDGHGVAGADVELACRLCDSDAARGVLDAAHAADLAVIVSDRLYQSVVRHGGRFIDPHCYGEVRVTVKETDTCAWVYVPGHSTPPAPRSASRATRGAGEGQAAAGGSRVVTVNGPTTMIEHGTFGDLVVGTVHHHVEDGTAR
ncbi:hypothetical protein F0L68_29200 [Solihabitans fulvus]|uniref:Guanylate cyclase domain-containing protein n=1 Tax=Solihabitans fulvus TaxID=1892852 RepID=A0A5B2WW16_9PSEU|nr:hypothetical protein [Solihabitans fulvus]KAA2254862.1 hypothetical protein F0L68_29200 [Solihabitans fulvus]